MYRIFAVEDDAVIASAVQRHLESWGYQVACAVRFDDVLSDFAAFDLDCHAVFIERINAVF